MSWRGSPYARRRSWVAALVFSTVLWFPSAFGSGQLAGDSPFTSHELEQLNKGELVTRASTEERGSLRLMGGASWQLIAAPPDAVFKALLDTRYYARMLPAVTKSHVVTQEAGSRIVRLEHKRGPLGLSYDVRARVYPERRDITFLLEDAPGGAPRAAWGFFAVRPYGAEQTLLSYGVMADPGEGIVVGILRGVVHEWMLAVPRQVKSFIESREGRARYR